MIRFMFLTLSILLFFRVEVFQFFTSLSLVQWIQILCISSLCLFYFRRKIKYKAISLRRKLKYFNPGKYRIKISKWAKENNPETMGKSLISQLERNMFTKFGCIALSTTIFSHYPSLLTSPKPATVFLLTLTAYSLISLAFRQDILFMIGMYSLMAIMPYAMAFLSQNTSINLFETLPVDVIYFLNIDILNPIQTANKLFLFITPWFILTLLFLILLSLIIRGSLKSIFAMFLKMLQFLAS